MLARAASSTIPARRPGWCRRAGSLHACSAAASHACRAAGSSGCPATASRYPDGGRGAGSGSTVAGGWAVTECTVVVP